MVKQPEHLNQKKLIRREQLEESKQRNLLRRMENPNQHYPNLQECVGKVKIEKVKREKEKMVKPI